MTKELAPVPSCFANSAGVLMGKDYHGSLFVQGSRSMAVRRRRMP